VVTRDTGSLGRGDRAILSSSFGGETRRAEVVRKKKKKKNLLEGSAKQPLLHQVEVHEHRPEQNDLYDIVNRGELSIDGKRRSALRIPRRSHMR